VPSSAFSPRVSGYDSQALTRRLRPGEGMAGPFRSQFVRSARLVHVRDLGVPHAVP
jgi:hypothetical protein